MDNLGAICLNLFTKFKMDTHDIAKAMWPITEAEVYNAMAEARERNLSGRVGLRHVQKHVLSTDSSGLPEGRPSQPVKISRD